MNKMQKRFVVLFLHTYINFHQNWYPSSGRKRKTKIVQKRDSKYERKKKFRKDKKNMSNGRLLLFIRIAL